MAITDTQKVDYLWKKVGYAATKTDITSVKEGYNESIPSPLQIRADKVMKDASGIPNVIPVSTIGVTSVYPTSSPRECTNDATASTNRTWLTGLTDWISPEFGSTYQAKVYIHTSGMASNAASAGTQVFAAGSGNNDEWFFDYQSGVLNFIGTNLPNGVSFTGKSVYISGARYIGTFGVGGGTGNITFANSTISTSETNGNIQLDPPGIGLVQIVGTNALGLPVGNTAQRPEYVTEGYVRYNTDTGGLEVYDGSSWDNTTSTITSQTLVPNGAANTFALSSSVGTASDLIVSVNGTVQQPITAYSVNGANIIFAETPVVGDSIEVRHIGFGVTSVNSLALGTSNISIPDASGSINISTNGTPALQIGTTGAIISTYPSTVIASSGIATNVDVFSSSVYRTAKYIFQANTSSQFESSEVVVVHNGTTAYRTVYAVVSTGASLGNISATLNGTDVVIQYTAANNNTNVRTLKQYIVI